MKQVLGSMYTAMHALRGRSDRDTFGVDRKRSALPMSAELLRHVAGGDGVAGPKGTWATASAPVAV